MMQDANRITKDRDELKKKSKSIWNEYFSIEDAKEAAECLQELESPGYHGQFVEHGINLVMEGNAKMREQLVSC